LERAATAAQQKLTEEAAKARDAEQGAENLQVELEQLRSTFASRRKSSQTNEPKVRIKFGRWSKMRRTRLQGCGESKRSSSTS
jgi:hypothetical protein